MLGSNKVEHNFSVNQLKGILRALNQQLGEMERGAGTKQEIRQKMLDIAHYNSMLYPMLDWNEYVEFDEELAEIRG
ncbi:MAG: hypothetical protein IJA72_00100 [Clostridia bacterium]|nr:hypothetical protein [Clostridia bacterium]